MVRRCVSRLQSRLLLPVPWRVRERTWERGCHLKYSIHGKELGSILLRHWKKIYLDLASTRFRIHSVFKNFHSVVRIKKICRFFCRILRIRVDGSRIRKEKVANSKISGYVWTEPEASSARIRIFLKVHMFYTNRPSIHTKPVNPLCRVVFNSWVRARVPRVIAGTGICKWVTRSLVVDALRN